MNKGECRYTRDHLRLYHRPDGRLLVSLTPHGAAINGGIYEAVPNLGGESVWLYYENPIIVCAYVPVLGDSTRVWLGMLGDDNGRHKPIMIFERGWTLDEGAKLMDRSEYLDFCEKEDEKND